MKDSAHPKIRAVVLAAGLSKRMGHRNKMLHPVDGQPLLVHVVQSLLQSTIDEIIVITGHQHNRVEEILPHHPLVRIAKNEHFRLGMSTSIKKGLEEVEDGDLGCLICLGDMPYLRGADYHIIIESARKKMAHHLIIKPTFKGASGHPIFFGSRFFRALLNLPDNDQGARSIIDQNLQSLRTLEMPNDHILCDVDQL